MRDEQKVEPHMRHNTDDTHIVKIRLAYILSSTQNKEDNVLLFARGALSHIPKVNRRTIKTTVCQEERRKHVRRWSR